MSDHTLQFKWIVVIKEGVGTLSRRDPNVFVGGNLLWYPVEGNHKSAGSRTSWLPSAGPRASGARTSNGRKAGSRPRSSSRCSHRATSVGK